MKAIRLYGPKDARWEDVPCPAPGPDEVLVRVRAAAVCATDIELYDGVMFYITTGMVRYPFTPGHEWSGEVVESGANAGAFRPGQRVVGECSIGCRECPMCRRGWYNLCPGRAETGLLKQAGAFAEYISFPRFYLHRFDGLAFEDAALIEPTAVALNAVRRTAVTSGDDVVVVGAGPVGLFAVQAAKVCGARKVILVDPLDERLCAGRDLGADSAVNAASQNPVGDVREITGGRMASVVIEAAGRKEAWPFIATILAPRARVALIGLCGGPACDVDFDPLVVNEISIFGCLGGPGLWPEAISLHQRGLVQSRRMLTHRLPLADFAQAIEVSRTRASGAIKVLLEP